MNIIICGLNPELSTTIQEYFFDRGYKWSNKHTYVKHTDSDCLMFWKDKRITFGYIDNSDSIVIDLKKDV